MSDYTATVTIPIGTGKQMGEADVVVEYSYSPGTPDVMYLKNGDPGYPGDPPELEIQTMTTPPIYGGKIRVPVPNWFFDAALDWITNDLEENHHIYNPEPEGPDPDDLRDAQRDRDEREWERDVEDMHKGEAT